MKEKLLDYLLRQQRFINATRREIVEARKDRDGSYWEGYEDALKAVEDKVNSI